MSHTHLLAPVFAQVALTMVLLVAMGRSRTAAVRSGAVKMREIALGQVDPWPARTQQIARAFHNQLEMPTLFYAAAAIAIAIKAISLPLIILAWIFALSRIAHALVHTRDNRVTQRFALFAVGVAALAGMWIMLGWQVFVVGV